MGLKGLVKTLALGAGAMYFLDPEQGEKRRAELRGKVTGWQDDMLDLWESGRRDLKYRARGLQADVKSGVTGGSDASTLLGQLNGGQAMAPGPRLLSLGGGGLLALYGLLRGGISGKIVTVAGLNFLTKGLTNKGILGMIQPSGENAISVRKNLFVNAPVEEVFNFWRNYDNFPRLMSHLEEVRDLGDGRSHWIAKGPAGVLVEWDATITQMQPNRVLAWQSLPGSQVYNTGRVRFTPAGEGTQVNIHMTYSPPAGAVGHAVATLFGADAQTAMDEDLEKLQSLLETGVAVSEGQTVTKVGFGAGVGSY
jgi:uncharacterized membrane protein